jgi:hypothetical protein
MPHSTRRFKVVENDVFGHLSW